MRFFKSFGLTLAIGLLALFLIVIFQSMQTTFSLAGDGGIQGAVEAAPKPPLNTKAVAAEIASIILAANPEGPRTVDGVEQIATLSAESMVQAVLANKIEASVASLLDVPIDNERFIIVPDADNSDRYYYLERRTKIMRDAAQLISQQNIRFEDQESITDLLLLVSVYDQAIKRIYALSVPEDFVFVHTEQIRLLETQKKIFQSLANYNSDPLMASLAVSIFEKTRQDEVSLHETLTDLIIRYGAAS